MGCCRVCGDSNPIINILNGPCGNTVSGTNWKQINVSEDIFINDSNPDIGSITGININAVVTGYNFVVTPDPMNNSNAEGTTLTGYKIIVTGYLNQTIMYQSDTIGGVYTFKNLKTFSTYVVMSPTYDYTKTPCISVCVEDMLVTKLNCREMLKNVALLIQVS